MRWCWYAFRWVCRWPRWRYMICRRHSNDGTANVTLMIDGCRASRCGAQLLLVRRAMLGEVRHCPKAVLSH